MTNRYVCTVIDEMRNLIKVLDAYNIPQVKSVVSSLLEEMQTMVNRMEESLYDKHDYNRLRKKIKKLKEEKKKLESELPQEDEPDYVPLSERLGYEEDD